MKGGPPPADPTEGMSMVYFFVGGAFCLICIMAGAFKYGWTDRYL